MLKWKTIFMQDGKYNERGHFFPDVNFVSVANTWEYVVAINPFGIDHIAIKWTLHTDLLVVVVPLKSFSPGLYARIEWAKKTAPLWCLKNFFSYFTDTNYLSLVYNLMVINTYGFLWINCTLLLLLSLACKIPYEKRLPEIFTKLKSGN